MRELIEGIDPKQLLRGPDHIVVRARRLIASRTLRLRSQQSVNTRPPTTCCSPEAC